MKKEDKLKNAIRESEYNKFLIIENERIAFLNDDQSPTKKNGTNQRTRINDSIAEEDDIGE